MKYTKIIKRETKLMIGVVLVLVVIVLGASYSMFMQVKSNTNNQVVTTGTLQIEYANTNNGYIENGVYPELLPMANSDGLKQTGYQFSVKNTGSLSSTYQVFLYVDQAGYNADKSSGKIKDQGALFDNLNLVKYNIQVNSDSNQDIKNLSEQPKKTENGIIKYNIYTGTVASNNAINTHILRVWLDDENTTDDEIGKYMYLKLEITGYVSGQEESIN